ncbi:MAG: adenosine monophosphate-protein transferase, partial [Candidatus Diapherotrites archaeon]|nr:adenosine monophosphate-protein transferase [Candidatus Diapherotrites archaeon]
MAGAKIEVLDFGTPDYEVIIGQGNFTIKTIEDIYDAVYSSVPGAK